ALQHVQADPAQSLHDGLAERVVLGGVLDGDDGLHVLGSSGREASSRLTRASTENRRRRRTGDSRASTRANSRVRDSSTWLAKARPAAVMATRLARRS